MHHHWWLIVQFMTGAYPFDDKRSPRVLHIVVRVALQPEAKILQHGRLFQGKLGKKNKVTTLNSST